MRHIGVFLSILMLFVANSCIAEEADSRLEQKATVQALSQPLGSFVTALGIQTGIVLKADKGVADYKITVLAKDLPVSQFLPGIAEALHIQLRTLKNSSGAPTYELYEEAAAREKADQLYKDARSGLRKQVDHAADALRLNLSAEELKKKMDSDAMLSPYIGDPSFRVGIEVYSKLPEKDRDRLWEIGMLPVPLDKVPEEIRKKIVALFDENRKQREEADKIKLTDTAGSLLFETQDDPLAGRALTFSIVGTGSHGMTYMYMQLEGSGPDLLGNDEFFTVKENKETGEYTTEARQIPDKLAADAKIELPEVTMLQALQRLHESSGANIIADQYTPRYSAQAYVDKWAITRGNTIADEVEKITEVYGCRWKYAGDACILSSKTWYEDRRVEIPMSTLQRWQSAYQKRLQYELPELVEMALLSEKQQRTFRYYGLSIPDSFYPCMRALRCYSALAPTEREQVATEQGLSAEKLAEDQRQSLIDWLVSPVGPERKPSPFTEESAKGAKIRIFERDPEWVFRVETSNGQVREDILQPK